MTQGINGALDNHNPFSSSNIRAVPHQLFTTTAKPGKVSVILCFSLNEQSSQLTSEGVPQRPPNELCIIAFMFN